MHKFYFSRFGLAQEATENPEPVIAGAAPATPAEADKPGVLSTAKAILAGAQANAATIAALRSDLAQLTTSLGIITTERDEAAAQVRKLTIERDEAFANLNAITVVLAETQAAVKTQESAVTDALAAAGVPARELPAAAPVAASNGEPESAADCEALILDLDAQASASTDPAEKNRLGKRINNLRLKAREFTKAGK